MDSGFSEEKKLLSIYICLIGLYKCKSSGLRNPTSHPHIAVILTVIISTLLRPTTDHQYGSFFCSLSTTLILMTDDRWACALTVAREREGRSLPSAWRRAPTSSMPSYDLIQQMHPS